MYCCARGVFCCCCFLQQTEAVCGVRHNFQNYMQNKIILCQSEHAKIPPHPNHTHIKKQFFIYGNSLYGPASWIHTKGDTSDIAIVQPAEHPRDSPPGSRVSEHMPLYPSCVRLRYCSVSRALANGALEAWKIYVGKDEVDRTGLGRAELLLSLIHI